jgi:hypothetical protein
VVTGACSREEDAGEAQGTIDLPGRCKGGDGAQGRKGRGRLAWRSARSSPERGRDGTPGRKGRGRRGSACAVVGGANLFMRIGEDGVGLGTNGFVRVFSVQGRSAGFGCRRSLFGWVAE